MFQLINNDDKYEQSSNSLHYNYWFTIVIWDFFSASVLFLFFVVSTLCHYPRVVRINNKDNVNNMFTEVRKHFFLIIISKSKYI